MLRDVACSYTILQFHTKKSQCVFVKNLDFNWSIFVVDLNLGVRQGEYTFLKTWSVCDVVTVFL